LKKFDWVKLSAIAEIAGSIAIVSTLIYLSIQTQQNADAILANSRNALIANEISINQQVVENPSIFAYRYRADLTLEEQIQLEVWLIQLVRTREHQWLQYQDGLLDEKIWDAYATALPVILSFPIERAWWDRYKYSYFDDGFADVVDRLLENTPINVNPRTGIGIAIEAAGL